MNAWAQDVLELTKRQEQLNELARSFARLRSFERELKRVSKGKRFNVNNLLIWDALHALRRTLVIDLSEWVDGLHSKWLRSRLQGATLGQLRNSRRLARAIVGARMSGGRLLDEPWNRRRWEKTTLEARRAALRHLFGSTVAARGKVSAADVTRLERKLYRWSTNLRELRNEYAHRFGEGRIDAKQLRLHHLARRISYCGRLMNSLRLLLDNSTYQLPSLAASGRDAESEDAVDLVVLGPLTAVVEVWQSEADGEFNWQKREAYYRRMHAQRRRRGQSFNLR